MRCPGVYHNPSPVPNPGSSSRVSLHQVPLTNTFVSGQGGGACIVCSIPLLPSMLGGVTPSSVIREILGEGSGHFARIMVQRRSAMPTHVQPLFIQAPECTQTRGSCDMDEGKTHEEVAHEKLVTRLARLRDAASEAVLWEDHAKLVQVAKAFTSITPTKRANAETGVGHLLADKTVWAKGGDAAMSLRNERPMHQDRGLAGAQLSQAQVRDCRRWRDVTEHGHPSPREIHQICGDVFGSGPKKTVQKLAAAGQDAEVTRLLEERARILRVECKKGSLSSVASGLHAWHAFATDILGYSESETLPPKQDVDVCKVLAIFRNPGTAANYVGYVKWACTHLSMVTSWWSPTVTLTLKGMRAEHLRATGGPALAKVLLTDEWVAQLARLSLAMNQTHVHAAVLVSSVFLLRVQSEAMGLEVGMKRDAQILPPGRHSAVWIESCEGGFDSLHIRLARRKHRPQGSLLVRTCTCAEASPHCCAVHAVAPLLRNKGAGATLFDLTSSSFLKADRRMLTLLGHRDANSEGVQGWKGHLACGSRLAKRRHLGSR